MQTKRVSVLQEHSKEEEALSMLSSTLKSIQGPSTVSLSPIPWSRPRTRRISTISTPGTRRTIRWW